MRLKKVFAGVLAAAMLVCAVAVPAFAAEEAVEVPYCITKALISAVQGDLDHGLIFVGANVDRIDRMTSVQELMAELTN